MLYLSEILNKKVYFNKRIYGEMVDFAVLESSQNPSISKVVIKTQGKKLTVAPSAMTINKNGAILTSDQVPFLPYDERDFYLNEDLLDKQVIDTDDKRLVRVNDLMLDDTKELKVIGIDIGAAGILRRLGLGKFIKLEPKVLPWQMIEAFDYHTGNVKLSLTQSRVNQMHPSDIADILEELGSRERRAVVESLEAKKAAAAIEETDFRTQEAILEEVSPSVLKKIVTRMHVAEVADLFYKLNPLRIKEILKFMGSERASKVKKLIDFGDDKAGGLMRTSYIGFDGNITIKEAYNSIYQLKPKPETILVTNGNEKLVGVIYTKDILDSDSLAILKDLVVDRKFVYPQASFNQVVSLFGRYNLRVLPVVDKDKKPIGIITVGIVLSKMEEKIQTDEFI